MSKVMTRMRGLVISAGLGFACVCSGGQWGGGQAALAQTPSNDYPTAARADYVFACMQVNGQTRDVLAKCSCSIDRIAELLPFDDYEQAETILSVVQKGGEKVGMFRSYGPLKDKVNKLRRAQVEAELICF